MLTLYDYPNSSASLRVRLALRLKHLPYETVSIHLLNEGGEQHRNTYRAINPQALVPSLKHDGVIIHQSMAILEYLEETFPDIPLLPYDRAARAYVRSISQAIACEMHPINNLRVLNYLTKLGVTQDGKERWSQHWLTLGFSALEEKIKKSIYLGRYCYQDQVTFADICLYAQMLRAKRFHFDFSDYPTLTRIDHACAALPEFKA